MKKLIALLFVACLFAGAAYAQPCYPNCLENLDPNGSLDGTGGTCAVCVPNPAHQGWFQCSWGLDHATDFYVQNGSGMSWCYVDPDHPQYCQMQGVMCYRYSDPRYSRMIGPKLPWWRSEAADVIATALSVLQVALGI
jgi:hypothetical protein